MNNNLIMIPIKGTLIVKNIVGSEICVSVDDGKKVYKYIKNIIDTKNAHVLEQIKEGNFDRSKDPVYKIDVDFEGVTDLTAAFLTSAIGELYNKPTLSFADKHIRYIGLSDDDKSFVDRVIANSISYYQNPKQWIKIMKQMIDDF